MRHILSIGMSFFVILFYVEFTTRFPGVVVAIIMALLCIALMGIWLRIVWGELS